MQPCIRDGFVGGDIGPKTVKEFEDVIQTACTIFWNGPLGAYEMPAFSFGTLAIAHAIAAATKKGATTIVGGGDSTAAVHEAGLTAADFTHICTGDWLSGITFHGHAPPQGKLCITSLEHRAALIEAPGVDFNMDLLFLIDCSLMDSLASINIIR